MKLSVRKIGLLIHLWHERAYTFWKVRETGVRFHSPLDYDERVFFLELWPVLADDNLVVYDIGAASGKVSCCLAKLPNVTAIHAFEPNPEVFVKLAERMRPYPHMQCHNVALSDDAGIMTMHISRSTDSSSLLPMAELHRTEFPGTDISHQVQVRVVRLDDYVSQVSLPQPHLVKIDVQGYEDRVLRGGEDTLRQAKYCVLEMSLQPLYEGSPLVDDIYQQMRAMGFRLIGFAGDLKGRSGQQLQVDGIFENERVYGNALPNP